MHAQRPDLTTIGTHARRRGNAKTAPEVKARSGKRRSDDW